MRIENLNKLIDANATLIRVAKRANVKLMDLKNWVDGFEDNDPPTQSQLDVKIAQLDMANLQTAFNNEKDIFLGTDVIPDPQP